MESPASVVPGGRRCPAAGRRPNPVEGGTPAVWSVTVPSRASARGRAAGHGVPSSDPSRGSQLCGVVHREHGMACLEGPGPRAMDRRVAPRPAPRGGRQKRRPWPCSRRLVEVKPIERILATLDAHRRHRGLRWMTGMRRYCGGRYRCTREWTGSCWRPTAGSDG